MATVKMFEVRDVGTKMMLLGVEYTAETNREALILDHVGLTREGSYSIQLTDLDTLKTERDAYNWTEARTMHQAHKYIEENWDELKTGEVIDIQYILGETNTPVETELYDPIASHLKEDYYNRPDTAKLTGVSRADLEWANSRGYFTTQKILIPGYKYKSMEVYTRAQVDYLLKHQDEYPNDRRMLEDFPRYN